MGQRWQDCIVCYFDLNGTKAAAAVPRAASKLMRGLHALVVKRVGSGFDRVARAYTWNDSALLLFHVGDDTGSYVTAMKQADEFKRAVDVVKRQGKLTPLRH